MSADKQDAAYLMKLVERDAIQKLEEYLLANIRPIIRDLAVEAIKGLEPAIMTYVNDSSRELVVRVIFGDEMRK